MIEQLSTFEIIPRWIFPRTVASFTKSSPNCNSIWPRNPNSTLLPNMRVPSLYQNPTNSLVFLSVATIKFPCCKVVAFNYTTYSAHRLLYLLYCLNYILKLIEERLEEDLPRIVVHIEIEPQNENLVGREMKKITPKNPNSFSFSSFMIEEKWYCSLEVL